MNVSVGNSLRKKSRSDISGALCRISLTVPCVCWGRRGDVGLAFHVVRAKVLVGFQPVC